MLDFPIHSLLDEAACYAWLVRHFHPAGLACPEGHPLPEGQAPHRTNAQGLPSFRCRRCRKVYNVVTGTAFSKTRQPPSKLVLILRGIAQGMTTARLSRELDLEYDNLLELRHRLQNALQEGFPPLADTGWYRRSRRDVPERRGEGNPASGPR